MAESSKKRKGELPKDGSPKKKRKANPWMAPKPGLAKYGRLGEEVHVDDEEVIALTKAYWGVIKTEKRKYETRTLYNFRSTSISPKIIMKKLEKVYEDQASYNGSGSIFKANIRVGMILMDRVTTQLFFYQPEGNTITLNKSPIIIQTRKDLERAKEELSGKDFREMLVNYAAPNSRFIFFQPTNIQIEVIPLEDFPLRGDLKATDFPESLVKHRDVYCFIKSGHGKILLHDNLCLFRCLSVYLMKTAPKKCEKDAKRLAREYCGERGVGFSTFPGVTMGELELVENCFDVGIKVYGGSEANVSSKFLCRLPQEGKKNGICQVFRFKNKHFCLIKPECEESFLGGFRCSKCKKFSRTKRDGNWHEVQCKGGSKLVVKSGEFVIRAKLVDELKKVQIIPKNESDVFQPYFIVFDAESCMEKPTNEMFSPKTVYDYKHKAIVLCAATNLPGETVKIFINDEDRLQPDKYLREFLLQVENWRDKAAKRNFDRTQYIFDYLDQTIADLEAKPNQFYYMRRLQLLRIKLVNHLEKINVLSFNGRSYDIPLMREHLLPLIHQYENGQHSEEEEKDDETEESKISEKIKGKKKSGVRFLLKQGASRYDAILGDKIRILDVLNYLGGQAVTLRSFVSDFAKDQKDKVDKAWFPYKFLKKIEKVQDLKQFGLPEINDFTSDMGEGNTLGKDDTEIEHNYIEFVKLWQEHKCKTL